MSVRWVLEASLRVFSEGRGVDDDERPGITNT